MLMSDTFSAALNNQTKNRGSPGEWFAHTADYRESPRQPRVRPEARRIAIRNQPHMSTAALAGYAERLRTMSEDDDSMELRPAEFDSEICPRVRLRTSEAEVIARKSIQTDKWHDFEGNLEYSSPVRPYRLGAGEDGQEILKNLTKKQDWFMHNTEPVSSETVSQRSMHTESAFRRRNDDHSWFVHNVAKSGSPVVNIVGHRRVHDDGIEIAVKNRGTTDILHMKKTHQPTQQEPYGCPSKEAQWNSRWSTKGSDMAACLGGLTNGKPQTMDSNEVKNETANRSTALRMRSAKVRGSDAEQWQIRSYQGSMALSAANKPKSKNCTRPEAQEFQTKSTSGSQLLNCLRITESSREGMPDDPQYNPVFPSRLRSEEAELAMQRNRGQMEQYLGKQVDSVTQPCGRKIHPRAIRSDEGYETVLKSTGANTKELLTHDALPLERIRSGFARLTDEAREMAQRTQQGLIGNLLGGKDQSNVPLIGVEAPAPQRLHYEAVEYAMRNRGGEMRSLIEQSQ
ncbi:Beta-ketoacyl synthase domain-containing protein [Paragonimus heterotremus]|uniref:Beta-ketoacyl synthase domain-containing protein n=1 Tax=Paragonimus heterotremus TaxID=100268 RepID=A0A8J4WG08_9TREM|nr:Beta-ketoacyl synthase domain-containing protein [Paragonimus heterotremus]